MERLIIHQDFGPSIVSYPSPATDLILRALPWTIGLLGDRDVARLDHRRGRRHLRRLGTKVARSRALITNFSLVLSHVPAYFVALFLVIFLAYRNPILPPNSAYDANLDKGFNWPFIVSVIEHGTLPVLATALVGGFATG